MTDIDLKRKGDVFSADFCHIERRSDLVWTTNVNVKNAKTQNNKTTLMAIEVLVLLWLGMIFRISWLDRM
jgi:hypothetical protein